MDVGGEPAESEPTFTPPGSPQGAASSEAHRSPSFGASPRGLSGIKIGPVIKITPKAKVKAFPHPEPPPLPEPSQPSQPRQPKTKPPPEIARRAVEKDKAEPVSEQQERQRSPRSRSRTNKIRERSNSTPSKPVVENWFRPSDPPPIVPDRPKRPPPVHQTLQQEQKTRKAPPDKAPPARFAAERGAASGAPAPPERFRLAPHPEADQGRQQGTWALVAPAQSVVTPLAGPKRSRIVSPADPKAARYTEETWQAGPRPELYHYGDDVSSLDASDSHESTSSDPPSAPPRAPKFKRTSSQAYSHSPPPPPQHLPQSRLNQPKSDQPSLDQPLSGTIEAPIVEEPARSTRTSRPEPPPQKKSRVEFGSRQLPFHPATSTSSRQVPIYMWTYHLNSLPVGYTWKPCILLRITFASSKTDTVFLLKRKTLFVFLSFLTLYHQHILCDLVVVFGSPCSIINESRLWFHFFHPTWGNDPNWLL